MLRKVLKKVPALAVGLALVLTASQLALAQQTAGTTAQQPSTTTPTQNGGTASDPGQFLTVDGQNLVISCPKLEEGLAQLAAQGNTSSDPQVQEQLQLAQSMDQLCKANGVGASDVTTPPTSTTGNTSSQHANDTGSVGTTVTQTEGGQDQTGQGQ